MLKYYDPWTPTTFLTYTVKQVYESFESEFQKIDVFEAEDFGTVLCLGGVTNVTDRDESPYHELLAHVALLAHPDPRRALIIGGGDGGTLREVLRHPTIEEAVLVDIDGDVIRVAKKYFPELSVSFDHPKANVIVGDGLAYVENAVERGERFDAILVDSTDPVDAAVELFTEGFYRGCADLLGDRGILVPQSDSPTFCMDRVVDIHAKLGGIFENVTPFFGHCLAYPGASWAFMAATNGRKVGDAPPQARWDAIDGELRYLNPAMYVATFAQAEHVRRALAGEPKTRLPAVSDTPE